MPLPPVDPIPPARESFLVEPLEAHEASYFAASARRASLSSTEGAMLAFWFRSGAKSSLRQLERAAVALPGPWAIMLGLPHGRALQIFEWSG
jgi:hypothetical protein